MHEQNQSLVYNASSGIIMSNQSLVLRGLTRNHSGNYKCIGVNSHGTGISNSLQLTVRFSPVCQQPIRNIRGAGRSQSLTLSCPVQSLPSPLKFRWVAPADSLLILHNFFLNWCIVCSVTSSISLIQFIELVEQFETVILWIRWQAVFWFAISLFDWSIKWSRFILL